MANISTDDVKYTISATDVTAVAVDSAVAGLKKINTEIDTFEARAKAQFANIQKHWMGLAAATYAAYATMKKGWDLMETAAKFEEQQAGLQGLAAQYGMTADAVTRMAQEAVQGQLSLVESSKLAGKALMLGFDPRHMATFLEVAERLTDVAGGTIPEAFEAMERAAATGRARGLVQYGIVVDLNRVLEDYAKKHGIAKDSISAHTAMQLRSNEILVEAKKVTDRLGEATLSTADRMNIMKANIQDAQLFMGQVLIRTVLAATGAFQWLASGILTVASAAPKAIEWMARLSAFIYDKTGQEDRAKSARAEADSWLATYTAMQGGAEELAGKAAANMEAAFASFSEFSGKSKAIMIADDRSKEEMSDKEKKRLEDLAALMREIQNKEFLAGLDHDAREMAQMVQRHAEELVKLQKLNATKEQMIAVLLLHMQEMYNLSDRQHTDAEIEAAKKLFEWRKKQAAEWIAITETQIKGDIDARTRGYDLLAQAVQEKEKVMTEIQAREMDARSRYKDAYSQFGETAPGFDAISKGFQLQTKLIVTEYSRQEQAAYEHMANMQEAYLWGSATQKQVTDATNSYIIAQQLNTDASRLNSTLGYLSMAQGAMQAYAAFAGEQGTAMFLVAKAIAIAMAIIQGHVAAMGAAAAVAAIPFVGPVLAQAAYDDMMLLTYINAAMMAAVAVGQATRGSPAVGGGMSVSSAGQMAYPVAETTKTEPVKAGPTINVHIYGNVVDHDKFTRELIPSLQKAFEDGAH